MKRSARTSNLTDQLAALSDVVRLRTLRLLEREELSVGELAKVLQMPQSSVSRHLKVLSDGEWVQRRTEGTATYYRVVLDDLPLAARALWVPIREQMSGAIGNDDALARDLAEDQHRLASVLAERREDSRTYFGRVAGQWDDVRTRLFGGLFALRGMLQLLPSEWTVVDLGCGTGNAAELLAPVVKRVVAVDQSEPMLAAARRRLEDAGAGNVAFVLGELEQLPLADASADAAVCVLVLHHVEHPARALSEVRRVLRPGGRVLVIDMVEHDRTSYRQTMGHRWLGFSKAAMERLAGEAGLSDARYTPLPAETEAAGPGLFAWTGRA